MILEYSKEVGRDAVPVLNLVLKFSTIRIHSVNWNLVYSSTRFSTRVYTLVHNLSQITAVVFASSTKFSTSS